MGRLQKRKTSAKRKHSPSRSRQGRQGDNNLVSSNDDKLKNGKSGAEQADEIKKTAEERKKTGLSHDRKGGKNKTSGVSRSVVSPNKKKLPSSEGYVGKSLQFLREVRAELKRVTWPSRKQTTGSTIVVIILVMIISFFLGLVDLGLSGLIRMVLR